MEWSATALLDCLQRCLPEDATGLVVALSGGLDSACLATALSQAKTFGSCDLPIRALHVDHGLQAEAVDFRAACTALCEKLDVPLTIVAVEVATAGVSVEAAARDARYAAVAEQLRPGECLITGHHAADQAETLLLQLLRGAGLKGLSAMPVRRRLGAGWHLRPLLEISQDALREFAARSGVIATSDPMNLDVRFDRSYLRMELWPLIEARWPGAASALGRASRHLAEAQDLLDESAACAVMRLEDGEGLSVMALRRLSVPLRLCAVRYWLNERGLIPPPAARLKEALRQVVDADENHCPSVVWNGHALRRYRDRMLVTPACPPCIDQTSEWCVGLGAVMVLSNGLGTLRWTSLSGGLDPNRLPKVLAVKRRRGGEALKIYRSGHTRSLQHLCQSLGIFPWMRDALPLLFAGETLVAVGDLWQDARWCVATDAVGLGIVWDAAPHLV